MNNRDKFKNENLNVDESKKDINDNKCDRKEIHNLQKKIITLENDIKKISSDIISKNEIIKNLNSQLDEFNSNYKKEIIKKSNEAQNSLDIKIKEYQEKFDKDIAYIKKYCLKDKLLELIDVISNFESALKSNSNDEAIQNYLKGFKMFLSMFKNYLNNNNVLEISIKPGDVFDERIMEPIDAEKNDDFTSNQVIRILKPGYMLHDLVIKPAIVVIAK